MIKEDRHYRTREGHVVRVVSAEDGLAYYSYTNHIIGVWQKTGRYFADGRQSPFDLIAPAPEDPK